MSNSTKKFGAVTKEFVRLIQANTIVPNVTDRSEDKRTGGEANSFQGTREGATMEFVQPIRFRGRDGIALSNEPIEERAVPLAKVEVSGVDIGLNILEISQDIVTNKENLKMFSDDYLRPSMQTLGALIDGKHLPTMYRAISNSVGVFGDAFSSPGLPALAVAELNKYEAPPGQRHMILSNNAVAEYKNAVSGAFNPSDVVSKQYKTGLIQDSQGLKTWETSRLIRHINGLFSGTITVGVAPVEGTNSITLTGFTAGDQLTPGTLFRIEDMNRVNQLNYTDSGEEQWYCVASATVADGGGNMVITTVEKFEASTSTSFQNISALPLVGAAVTIDGASDEASMQNMVFHEHAFLFGCTKLGNIYPKGSGNELNIYDEESKLRIKCTTDGQIDDLSAISRIDVAHGLAAYWTPWATRINSNT